jgi:hypothetical protein
MSNQTAIEWLEMQIVELEKDYAIPHKIYELCEQAKQMHKEEIIKAYRDGRSDQQSQKELRWYNRNAEYYYNETYKQ